MRPGAFVPARDRWGTFASLVGSAPLPALAAIDSRVARLHPEVTAALRRRAIPGLALRGGEASKSFRGLQAILRAGIALPRSGTLLAIGGGTVGDVATVAAGLLKRGVRLIHVPTTTLALVDSSVGGKGAIHVPAGSHLVKNAAGLFHFPVETWVCLELLETLPERRRREGLVEALKAAVCLDGTAWQRYRRRLPSWTRLVREARGLKGAVCARDPYERAGGERQLLNFGHTFGHALESLTGFRLTHGEAVALGITCALDVGRRAGVTSAGLAAEVERAFEAAAGPERGDGWSRRALARALQRRRASEIASLLAGDKKRGLDGRLRMVLLDRPGTARVADVPDRAWRELLPCWRAGERP